MSENESDVETPAPEGDEADPGFLDRIGLGKDGIGGGAVSGFATGLFSIPEGMAYAQLAGVDPVYGIYSGMVATLVAALSTGTLLMISTLTSAIALSTGSVLEEAGIDSSDTGALFMVTFLVGSVMFVLGLLRLGSLLNYVSHAVMTGFVAGVALLIIVGELGDFSGYDPTGDNDFQEVLDWFANISEWDMTTTLMGVATIVMTLVLARIKATARMGAVITVLVMSAIAYFFDMDIALVEDIAEIPRGLPAPEVPDFSAAPDLAVGSIAVALVALVQGAGISTAYPNPDGTRASQTKDFVGEGLGNLAGSFFQSMGTGGSLSRTGISVNAGAISRWGGVFAAIWLAVIVLLFAPLAELVPLTVIAGLLFVIASELIIGRIPDAMLVFRTSVGASVAMVATFVTALFIPLQDTIFVGAAISLLLYIYSSSVQSSAIRLVRRDDGRWEEQELPETMPSNDTTVVEWTGPRFFVEVPRFRDTIPDFDETTGGVLVLRLRGFSALGSTYVKMIETLVEELDRGGNILMLEGVEPGVRESLAVTGAEEIIGSDHIFDVQPVLGGALDEAVDAADAWITSGASVPSTSDEGERD